MKLSVVSMLFYVNSHCLVAISTPVLKTAYISLFHKMPIDLSIRPTFKRLFNSYIIIVTSDSDGNSGCQW